MNEYLEFQAMGDPTANSVLMRKKDSICLHTQGMDVTQDIEGPVYRCIECGELMPLAAFRLPE